MYIYSFIYIHGIQQQDPKGGTPTVGPQNATPLTAGPQTPCLIMNFKPSLSTCSDVKITKDVSELIIRLQTMIQQLTNVQI